MGQDHASAAIPPEAKLVHGFPAEDVSSESLPLMVLTKVTHCSVSPASSKVMYFVHWSAI